MLDPERQQSAREDLGAILRELRRAAGLSGARLAVRCAISQSKISRIETGEILPAVLDVERLLKGMDVPSDVAKPLLDMARVANVQYKSWRAQAERGVWRKQEELRAVVESSTEVRYFNPNAPSGMLHTEDYATAVLTPTVKGRPARNVPRAVAARLQRQEALRDTTRSFLFLMIEQPLRWQRSSPKVMAELCGRIAAVATWPNVTVGILQNHTTMPEVPLNSFVLYDDRFVLSESFSGEMILRDPLDVSYHRNLFELFLARALTGDEAVSFLRSMESEFMRDRGSSSPSRSSPL